MPLGMAKKLILLSADKYDTSFSINQYVSVKSLIKLSCAFPLCVDEASLPSQS